MNAGEQLLKPPSDIAPAVELVLGLVEAALTAGMDREQILETLDSILKRPDEYVNHPLFGKLAKGLAQPPDG